jgi:hypothetical protein
MNNPPISKPFISIILPAIRQDRWDDLYDSVLLACKKYSFELIFCGPLPLTEKLQSLVDVKYAKDLGSPTRASNIACSLAEGLLITWIADDCLMIEDSIDNNIDLLLSMGDNKRNVVIQKYFEAGNITKNEYLIINNSRNGSPYFNNSWVGFNNPIMYRQYYESLGGLDAYFDACPTAHNDLAIRAQAQGAIVKISEFPFLNCGWMEGGTGDHKAIYLSQEQVDEPKFRHKYHNPAWNLNELNIPIDNWKNAETVWSVRFKNGIPKTYQNILDENESASL